MSLQTVAFRYTSASDVSAVVPYICRQTSAQSVATVVLFSVVSVSGSLSVCVCVIVNAITPEPFHKISVAAIYGQKLGRLRKWLHTDALRRAWCLTFCYIFGRPSTLFSCSFLCV